MKYQPHIDGLRAVAVLSVLFFHLDIVAFQGGYVGVDIFFVISGFLITFIIREEIKNTGDFRFANFYIRRARRLLPALFFVLILSAIAAYILLSSIGLYEFGKELIFSTFSIANIHFWLQSGYFDSTADTKALLHMWSLSVEEQFYLIWPLSLVLVFRYYSKKTVFAIGTLLFLASLIANIVLANIELSWLYNQTEMMFYHTPFRVYEFLLGAFGVWAFHKVPSNRLFHEGLFLIGLVSIVVSVKAFSSDIPFPYYNALLPCVGALCIIMARNSRLSKIVLANKMMVSIGLISYSLYLVHWPIIVFLKYFRFIDLSSLDLIIVLIGSFTLSILIYLGIEKPLRFSGSRDFSQKPSKPNMRFLQGSAAIASVLIIFASVTMLRTDLFGDRKELITQNELKAGKDQRYDLTRKSCQLIDLKSGNCKNEAPNQVLIIGDSHEVDGYNIFHTMFGLDQSTNLIRFGGTNYCDLREEATRSEITSDVERNSCNVRVSKLNDRDFIQSIDLVVFSSNRPFALNELNA